MELEGAADLGEEWGGRLYGMHADGHAGGLKIFTQAVRDEVLRGPAPMRRPRWPES